MEAVIEKTVQFVKDVLANAEGGHDWWHIHRVWNNAKQIAQHENVDLLIVELGALLHDIADSKFHNGYEEIGPKKAREFLQSLAVEEAVIDQVEKIIRHISFKGEKNVQVFTSPELDVVQDADRLDALGAIGIARAFSYGGHKNRRLYDPNCKPKMGMGKAEYKNHEGTTINHFYEKLLLLKDRMNTATGKKLANERHVFMEQFLEEFFKECDGKN